MFAGNNVTIMSINAANIAAHIACIVVALDWETSDVFRDNFYKIPIENLKLEIQPDEETGPFRFLAIFLTKNALGEINVAANMTSGIYFLRKIKEISRVTLRDIQNEFNKCQ